MKEDLKNFIVIAETDSTNNYANHLISTGLVENGTAVLSYFQKKGRGQRDNQWESAPKMNLLVSYIVFPEFLPVPRQFYLSKIVSLALVMWLKEKGIHASIKWPNDIYVENKKIAGILIETAVKGSTFYSAVAGIGLNINQTSFSSYIPRPVSMSMVTGKQYDVIHAGEEIRALFMELYQKLKSGKFEEIYASYLSHLYRIGQWAQFNDHKEVFEARIAGIGEYGQLLLEDGAGKIRSYVFKEVEFII